MEPIVVLNPTAEPEPLADVTLAPRLPGLAGRRIGLLDNGKYNAGALLDLVAQELAARFPGLTFVRVKKPSSAKPLPPEQLAALQQGCDAVIAGIGD